MNIQKITLVQIVAFLFLNVYTGKSQEPSIDSTIDNLFSEYDLTTPGISMAIVKDGKTIFTKSYGLANLEYDIPINNKTVFHVASVSKQFTAFSIYLLEKEGKLSFEDDIRNYFPELPKYDKTIKIKHLLAHNSGLRDQWALLTLAGWHMEDVISTNQILELISRQKGLNFETGTKFGYCNTAYTLLAKIVAIISGKTFPQFTKEHIFDPLGMTNTQFYDDYHQLIKNRAYSYEKVGQEYLKKKLNYQNVGPTSLMTTPEDLGEWVKNLENPKVGDLNMIKSFNEVSVFDNGDPVIWAASPGDTTFHAKGQLLWKHRGAQVISHGGHDAGFRSVLTRFPKHSFSVIILSNDEHAQLISKVLAIADEILKDDLEPVVEIPASPQTNAQFETKIKFEPKAYVGEYTSKELETDYNIKMVENELILSHIRLGEMKLTPTGKDTFSGVNSFSFEILFNRNKSGITGFEISNFGVKKLKFRKNKLTI